MFSHQPSSVRNGVQKSRNWMLMSIARASARMFGSDGARKKWRRQERMKNQMARTASAENDTIGRRTMPNHLREKIEHARRYHPRQRKAEREKGSLFLYAVSGLQSFYATDELLGEIYNRSARVRKERTNSAVKAIRVTVIVNRMIQAQGLTLGTANSSSRSFSSASCGISGCGMNALPSPGGSCR